MTTFLHLSPHPDDEVLGAGAALAGLVEHGHRVINVACSLGRANDHHRRHDELTRAASIIGFETVILDPLASIGGDDDRTAGARRVSEALAMLVNSVGADIVVSPHLHDSHHGHEAVARGVRDYLVSSPGRVWWMWGLWADLPMPTIYAPYDEDTAGVVLRSLAEYHGENARSGYDRMYTGRAATYRCLGSERVFGFGSPSASPAPYADLLTEARYTGTRWELAAPKVLNLHASTDTCWISDDMSWWFETDSVSDRRRRIVADRTA